MQLRVDNLHVNFLNRILSDFLTTLLDHIMGVLMPGEPAPETDKPPKYDPNQGVSLMEIMVTRGRV